MYIHSNNDDDSTTLGCGTALSRLARSNTRKKGLYDVSTELLTEDNSGSSLSLCSQNTYMNYKGEQPESKFLEEMEYPLSGISSKQKALEKNSSSLQDIYISKSGNLDLVFAPILMSRVPKTKNVFDSGKIVQTRRNAEIKASEMYMKRNSVGKISLSSESDDQTKKNNALGNLMAWFQRKSSNDDNTERSPFKRSASLHGVSSSKTSRRAAANGFEDTRDRMSDSTDENEVIIRRNSFTSGRRRSFKKRPSRRGKRSIADENIKPELTLDEMIKNKVALQAFREFLMLEHSEENLDFWLDCEIYKSLKSAKQAKMAFKIFSQYLARSATREVNIDFETRARTEERLKNPDKDTFIEPQNCIYNLMKNDTFRRFISSEICSKLPNFLCNEKISQETRKKFNFKNATKKTKLPR